MLRIRLRRSGKKGQNFYRVVVADQRSPRDGAFLEILGSYNPHTNPPTTTINKDVIKNWIDQGAQPSEAVAKILKRLDSGGIIPEPISTDTIDQESEKTENASPSLATSESEPAETVEATPSTEELAGEIDSETNETSNELKTEDTKPEKTE